MTFRLGCIADDITGGTDLALALTKNGLKVVQILGDDDAPIPDTDAVVISLKIRTAPKSEATTKAMKALGALKEWGASQIYFKYCSTFDSTSEGNIGPIAEALNSRIKSEVVPFVPAFPENGRTVCQGHLYVNGTLLSKSSMKDHPLTPMTESNLRRHLTPQLETGQVGLIPLETIENGPKAIEDAMQNAFETGHNFLIFDCMQDAHISAIATACEDLPLLTGGSAFAGAIARLSSVETQAVSEAAFPQRNGPIAILSGSCSAASIEQIKNAKSFCPVLPLRMESHPADLVSEAQLQMNDGVICISSTTSSDIVTETQTQYGKAAAGEAIEQKFADIAAGLYQAGFRTFVIGGGETSGAVASALGLKSLAVGPEITPGVPWMTDTGQSGITIAFKSGNFGGPEFFTQAVNSLVHERSTDDPDA